MKANSQLTEGHLSLEGGILKKYYQEARLTDGTQAQSCYIYFARTLSRNGNQIPVIGAQGSFAEESRTPEDGAWKLACKRRKPLHIWSAQSLTAVNSLTNICQQDELHTKGGNVTPAGALGCPHAEHPRVWFLPTQLRKLVRQRHFRSEPPRPPRRGGSALGKSKVH